MLAVEGVALPYHSIGTRLHGPIEILNTITHTSLSCKIHHHCWLILTKYIIDIATVSNINFLVIDIVNANNGSSFHISKQSLY